MIPASLIALHTIALQAAPSIFDRVWWEGLLSTFVYAVVGMALFGLAMKIIVVVSPFSIRKEIEEDQNVSLAIIMGAVFIGLAIIFAASIVG